MRALLKGLMPWMFQISTRRLFHNFRAADWKYARSPSVGRLCALAGTNKVTFLDLRLYRSKPKSPQIFVSFKKPSGASTNDMPGHCFAPFLAHLVSPARLKGNRNYCYAGYILNWLNLRIPHLLTVEPATLWPPRYYGHQCY